MMPQRWKLERGPDGAWNTAQMTTTEDGEWCKASDVAAALAQARREGVEALLAAAREEQYAALAFIGENREWVVRILDLEGWATRLLSPGNTTKRGVR